MWCVYSSWLLLLMLFPSHLSAQGDCSIDGPQSFHFSSDLYLKLESALINDHKSMLEELRVGFSSFDINYITFEVEIHVVSVDPDCEELSSSPLSFCPARNVASEYKWELCDESVKINFLTSFASELNYENAILKINQFLVWASAVHGSVLTVVLTQTTGVLYTSQSKVEDSNIILSIKLNIDTLDCNDRLECDISDLFSWVSSSCIYTFLILHMESILRVYNNNNVYNI